MNAKEKWAKLAQRLNGEIDEVLAIDPFADWKSLQRPQSQASGEFLMALYLMLGAPNSKHITTFLERALKVVDRAFRERKCEQGKATDEFPWNRGELLRIRYFAEELAVPGSGNVEDLKNAADDIWTWHAESPQRTFWAREDVQANMLGTARLALLADDLPRADRALNPKWPYRHSQVELEILGGIRDACAKGRTLNAKLMRKLADFFDEIRIPGFSSGSDITFLRIEIAGLRDLALGNAGPVNWARAVHSIAH